MDAELTGIEKYILEFEGRSMKKNTCKSCKKVIDLLHMKNWTVEDVLYLLDLGISFDLIIYNLVIAKFGGYHYFSKKTGIYRGQISKWGRLEILPNTISRNKLEEAFGIDLFQPTIINRIKPPKEKQNKS